MTSAIKKPSTNRRSAFTLLELMVVAVLMILLTGVTASYWRYFSLQTADLKDRSVASQELRLALHTLRTDLGMVRQITTTDDTRMRIYTGPVGSEQVIDYWVQGSALYRQDVNTGLKVPLVAHVSSFQAHNLSDTLVRIVVDVACGQTNRQFTLMWSKP